MSTEANLSLRDENDLRWCWLEDERDAYVVVSERMELVYINAAGRQLVPGPWFGKRCFEAFPVIDETCAFHCPKINDVNESRDIVYCEELVQTEPGADTSATFGVGLIPLGPSTEGRARAVLLMRRKEMGEDQQEFQAKLLRDAESVRRRIPTT